MTEVINSRFLEDKMFICCLLNKPEVPKIFYIMAHIGNIYIQKGDQLKGDQHNTYNT